SLHRGPDELNLLLGREPLAAHGHRRTHGTLLRRDTQASHKAAGRFTERHFRSKVGRSRRGKRGRVECERKRERAGKRDHSPVYDAGYHGSPFRSVTSWQAVE